ncbi:hypothetical protein KUR45_001705 [Escherichia coli]|nr:hypothetical protein [Escherichia coli]
MSTGRKRINKYRVKAMKKFFIFLLALVACQVHAATSGVKNVDIGTVDLERSHRTDEWVTIKTINIAEQDQNDGCGWLCTMTGDVYSYYTQKPLARAIWTVNSLQAVETPSGKIQVRVVPSDVMMRLGIYNYVNKREFSTQANVSKNTDWVTVEPANPCGATYGCTYYARVGLVSGRLDVQVQMPVVLSQKKYVLNNLKLGDLNVQITPRKDENQDYSTRNMSSLTLSGTIGVPDRCYITIDDGHENPATQLIEFKEIDASSLTAGKELQSKTIKLHSYCVGVQAEKNVYSEVKLGPAGDSIFQDNYILKLKPQKNVESGSDRYLGIVVKALSSTGGQGCTQDSNVFTNDTYKYMGVVVIAGPGGSISGLSAPYPLVFSLCSYGSSGNVLTPGDHTGAVTLTTRWRFDS